jgi:putative SOS response-associated peptidase YedK
MPVILEPQAYDMWLDPAERSPDELGTWLRPYPASQMTAHPVSTFVNSPANDSSACIAPVD